MASNAINGAYTVVSAVFGGANTVITVSEAVSAVSLQALGRVTKGIVTGYTLVTPGTGISVGNGQATTPSAVQMDVVGVNVAGKSFSVSGDVTGLFAAPYGTYVRLTTPSLSVQLTLASAVYSSPNTVITVTEVIAAYADALTIGPQSGFFKYGDDLTGWGEGMTIDVTEVG